MTSNNNGRKRRGDRRVIPERRKSNVERNRRLEEKLSIVEKDRDALIARLDNAVTLLSRSRTLIGDMLRELEEQLPYPHMCSDENCWCNKEH